MTEKRAFTVAIVDDDPAIRRLVRMFLRREGYEVFECTTGQEARDQLSDVMWDICVLDRRLPDTDGALLCKELKANENFRDRYIIMLTGEDEQQDKVEGLDLGADDYVTKPFQHAELLARVRAGKRIVDLQAELKERNAALARLSITDGLTGLNNHRHFQDELLRAFEESERYNRPLSLALIDLDFFKKINDTYGHAAGDEVLRGVSNIFTTSIRAADIAARYGGEEFTVMMPETDLADGVLVAEKIRELIEQHTFRTAAGEIPVTVSIGVATFPRSRMRSARELIEAADKALYRAKRGGRNQVQVERRSDGLRRAPRTDGKAEGSSQ